jgi:N-dimethylarginine dimethylaminohydrolase
MGRRVVFVEGPVNFVGNGDAVLVPSSSDRAAEALAREGLRVVRTDISELEKGDAGATCLSLRECTGV